MKNWITAILVILAVLVLVAIWAVRFGPLSFVTGYFLVPPSDPKGQIELIEPADSIRYFLYRPPGYTGAEATPYPVIVHLHGAMPFPWPVAKRMVHADLAALASSLEYLAATGDVSPAVIIAPYDGFGFSMWSDSSSGHETVETDIVEKILPHIADTLNVANTRDQTWIQGFSMGGFGALKIGLKYPDIFGRVTSWDGAVHDWQSLNQTRPGIVENMFANEGDFDRHSPWTAAADLNLANSPDIQLFSGTMAAPAQYTAKFRKHLDNLGLRYQFEETACPHDIFCFMTEERVNSVYKMKPR